ncbi:MAG: hypothetical protein II983_06175 [Firmicutes bacterium]|nr:hypothetical protein [Methanobrevibacter sp.]MBQ4505244.1 hypothetical protein [Bacillota bacterium]
MKKFLINVITFIPKVIIGIISLVVVGVLWGYVMAKIGLGKVFGFLTCDGN